MLADDFRLSKNHRTGLVDACVYQDGRKIPDYEKFAGFMHIAVPTYESIFRRLFGYHDISTTVLSMQDNSQKERIFGEFLSMEIVKDNIPRRLLEMTKVIFTEQLGLNLRNNIAHGLCDVRDFDKNNAYIVFGMLILITRFDWIDYQQKVTTGIGTNGGNGQ